MSAAMTGLAGGYRVQRATRASRVAAVGGLALFVVLAALPAWGSSGLMRLMVEFFTLLAMAQMWNLLAGYAGLVSIGQQAFVGVGAYALFVLLDRLTLPPLVAIPAIALIAGGIAIVTSLFAFRLRGGYLAIGTWVIAEVFRLLVAGSRELGAGTGVTVQSLVQMRGADRLLLAYWLALAVGAGSILLVAVVMRSRIGLALRAMRDSEISASSLGVDVVAAKRVVYVIASAGCAVAAAVFYLQALRIQPTAAFSVDWTARMIFIVVIGGLGRIEGPIVGAIVFFTLQETLADFGSVYLVALGVVAIAIVLAAPRGLWGLVEARWPVALFGIQQRLVPAGSVRPPEPRAEGTDEMVSER